MAGSCQLRLLLCLPLWLLLLQHTECGMTIGDDLKDVPDSEEDEAWKEFGARKAKGKKDPLDAAFTDPPGSRPQLCFVKLHPDPKRSSKSDVEKLASVWTSMLRTGGERHNLYAVDVNTLLVQSNNDEEVMEAKRFFLEKPEVYEFEWNSQKFRRPGDPPYDQVYPPRMPPRMAPTPKQNGRKPDKVRGKSKKPAPPDREL